MTIFWERIFFSGRLKACLFTANHAEPSPSDASVAPEGRKISVSLLFYFGGVDSCPFGVGVAACPLVHFRQAAPGRGNIRLQIRRLLLILGRLLDISQRLPRGS